jgi:hypothetical protein
MPVAAMLCAVVALIACALPGVGMFVAMGAGIAGVGLGRIGFRRRHAPGPRRLLAAAAMAIAGLALLLAAARYALTLVALARVLAALS